MEEALINEEELQEINKENKEEKEENQVENKEEPKREEVSNFVPVEAQKSYTYDEALNGFGFGVYQIVLMLLCGAGWFFDGVELLLISFILPEMKNEFKLNPIQTGF
jgi:hypothetical protein